MTRCPPITAHLQDVAHPADVVSPPGVAAAPLAQEGVPGPGVGGPGGGAVHQHHRRLLPSLRCVDRDHKSLVTKYQMFIVYVLRGSIVHFVNCSFIPDKFLIEISRRNIAGDPLQCVIQFGRSKILLCLRMGYIILL